MPQSGCSGQRIIRSSWLLEALIGWAVTRHFPQLFLSNPHHLCITVTHFQPLVRLLGLLSFSHRFSLLLSWVNLNTCATHTSRANDAFVSCVVLRRCISTIDAVQNLCQKYSLAGFDTNYSVHPAPFGIPSRREHVRRLRANVVSESSLLVWR